MRPIYLDYNATTPIAPAVQEAMLPFLAQHFGNPSSNHTLGRACYEAVEDARLRVARLLGVDRDEIVFTSGGTESNNLAIKGVALRHAPAGSGHLVISTIEHPAVLEPARYLESLGYGLTLVDCDNQGVVDPEAVEAAIRPDTVLVSIMHANNEIGTVEPISQIAEICRARGVLVHTDAAQTVGKIPTRARELGVDLLSIAGHKMYAPKGIGALYVRRGVALESQMHGAGHERGMRAGTENVPFIVGLGRAASLAENSLTSSVDHLASLRDRLQRQLCEGIGKELVVNAARADRLPSTLSVNFPRVSASVMLRRIPELCASTGAACHSGSENLSATLAAIGLTARITRGTMRLSVGWYTTEEEIDRAVNLLVAAWEGAV
ncbi:MAG TPA: cysteine desulfurase family protein [Thermoguttaceae bacterium]|nr:cysteine desulfurase family protein [Thermoguttaceae bacterium]